MTGTFLNQQILQKLRCAVYTRKSSEEGLDMEFNSLDAQREAGEAFIASQKAEGWILVPDRYDDGGISGATLERPALRRLLKDVEAGKINIVVVYKIDRLSRSLGDFTRLVEVFERNKVTFISITQSFNTTTSMGRLTLNILLSFGQFEREVIGERIRDKFAASRKRGMWMGGYVPLGYSVRDRKLHINEAEAIIVRRIFDRFIEVGSTTRLATELLSSRTFTRSGKPMSKQFIYKLLNNRIYLGDVVHKGARYDGEHRAIISSDQWQRAHTILKESPRSRAAKNRNQTPALLKGLIFGPSGLAMTPTHTRRKGKLYRYYVCINTIKFSASEAASPRLPAAEAEQAVINEVRKMLQAPELISRVFQAVQKLGSNLSEFEVRAGLHEFDGVWDQLFSVEQSRIIQLLVQRVDVSAQGLSIQLRMDGLTRLVGETGRRSVA